MFTKSNQADGRKLFLTLLLLAFSLLAFGSGNAQAQGASPSNAPDGHSYSPDEWRVYQKRVLRQAAFFTVVEIL